MKVRSVLFRIYFFFATCLCAIGGYPLAFAGFDTAYYVSAVWARLVLIGLRGVLSIRVRMRGLERLPDGPCLLLPNHQSTFDISVFFLADRKRRVVYLAKKELEKV
ncbi:MAG: 1-acyl-sn-glycerol-3-phosphate acyltransferase, partial [Planctomycetota bacterium]